MRNWIEDLMCRILRALGAGEKLVHLFVQIERFALIGVLTFLVDYGLLVFLTEVCGVHYLLSAAVSFLASTLLNYLFSARFVFRLNDGQGRAAQVVIYILLSAVGLGINHAILWVMGEKLGVSYMLSKIVSGAVVAVYNFVSRKLLLEKKEAGHGKEERP